MVLWLLCALLVNPAPDDALPFPTAEPAAVGIDPTALERLKVKAESEQSDTVVIVKDGKLIADWDFGKPRGPIEAILASTVFGFPRRREHAGQVERGQ
jgi:hypothetical protein